MQLTVDFSILQVYFLLFVFSTSDTKRNVSHCVGVGMPISPQLNVGK